ncbi:DUF6482 family protein [Alteromonas oceanisediminis]|uniref:DUF6482 family protein n=1 Tax=Alteromonas oceanisediminis TaxID=2836180 RepID=UPI001BDB2AEB|nr:DUF6482 family protein [Alteromonas oceanisediminis]MBT0587904.1 NADH-quinone reductase [Alteromonas oceanisediminis]
MKFKYSSIPLQGFQIDLLEVHSFEMNVYLVALNVGRNSGMVYDDKNKPKRFYSTQQIREAFADCRVEKAVMVHDTPYDEMIGNPPKASNKMALPFSMQQPY